MRICQLCAVDFTAWHLLRPLGLACRAAGWETTFCCSPGEELDRLAGEGFRTAPVPIERSYHPGRHLVSVARLVRLFRRERFDVVHAHTPVAGLLGRVAARLAGVPRVVYTAHGFYFHEGMRPPVKRIFVELERFGGRLSDLVFVQSEEDWREALAMRIAPPDQLVHIGNGVDPDTFERNRWRKEAAGIRRRLSSGAGPVVGFVGRLVREKGVVEFVRAAAAVAARRPEAVFVMIGAPLESDRDGCVREIEELRRSLGLGEQLVFAGYRRDVPAFLAALDLFVLPSHREGMPRALLEAMATALPVVATDIRGCREEVVDGETGLLVPVRDPTALASAIGLLLDDPERRRRYGDAGRRRVLDRFDERRIVALQVERIGRLLA
ncbi:MAG: glycosyltransferase family 4 protein [Candidatus Krumholzibacteriota bacterium]|nr:glycosyltransferase family 4 protein [Candidatus Krumholzibacteriota bacterium]